MRHTLLLLVALLGCDPTPQPTGDGATDVTPDRGQFCVPGSIATCTCPNGDISELPCNGSGAYYDSCRCGGPDVPQPIDRPLEAAVDGDSDGDVAPDRGRVCVPGSIATCTCPNGDISELPCNGSGAYYDSCRCVPPDVPRPIDRPLEAAVDGDSDGGNDVGMDAGGDVTSDASG